LRDYVAIFTASHVPHFLEGGRKYRTPEPGQGGSEMNANDQTDDHTTKASSVLIELDGVEQLATLVYGGNIGGMDLNVRNNDPRLLSEARAFARAVHRRCPGLCLSGEQILNLTILVAIEVHTNL